PSAARYQATSRSARLRAAACGRCPYRTRRQLRWSASVAVATLTSPDDYVFANRLGHRIDGSALKRRFDRARDAAGLEPMRFHDLRHTYGSLLVAGGIDLASVKAAMGHSQIATTERYLHARPASELAERFTRALGATRLKMSS